MQELLWLVQPIHVLLSGGGWEAAMATDGFQVLAVIVLALVPSSIIALGIGMTDWRETPLALWLGFRPKADDSSWVERARDLDKDGNPDF